jgi:phosphoribosylformimino-5-aminoimidazole carboxamide ribotide isomerase
VPVIAWPAVDLRGGRVVQWVGGDPRAERVSLPDPVAVAERWVEAGFAALHVVDLDAALGHGDQRGIVREMLGRVAVPVQVGGGVRGERDVDELVAAGAARVVVGTRAVSDRPWLERVAAAHPGRLVVAADTRGGRVLTHGWTASAGLEVDDFVAGLAGLPLAAVLVTDVDREGQARGADLPLFRRLASVSGPPLLAAGGIASAEDLAGLAAARVAGAVLGMALYTGALDAPVVAREYRA